ncbi:uncharacterized protein LOC110907003 [Helianthus annuus]|uniref:uncharacterized protein LOC110907003 n=1 Tax=Helianthus annuus TaxID=4232 RepID=UPI000B8F924F|nr:uncharacterized protein LOC110907003 [Helianthus annuus]
MKDCLIRLPTLTAPVKGEPLVMYLSASDKAVGAVLLVDRQGVQTPVCYVSRTLNNPETRYAIMEKLVLALIHASRRLRRYFANHVTHVLTNYNISNILARPEISGRLAKWAIELGGHNVVFRPRPAIKGQVLADFMTEVPDDKDRECKATEKAERQHTEEPWLMYTDGASNEDGAGAGLRLVSPDKHEFTYAIRLDFKSTNNEVEYEAFLAGLRLAIKMKSTHSGACGLHVSSRANQWPIRRQRRRDALYLDQAKTLLHNFYSYKVHHINRRENKPADALSKLASTSFQHLAKDVRIEVLSNPSVPLREVSVIQLGTTSWMTPIILYLQSGVPPENKAEARKVQYKSEHYQMVDRILYRKSYLGPLLRCVDPEDANYLIREVHESICGIHAGPRMVVAKVMNVGYYWPGMHLDAVKILRKCSGYQRHAPKTMRPKNELVPVTTAWPFQQWGIDMVDPFPEAPGTVKFIIVVVDYFTKWVEAKALASTTSTVVRRFIWEQIICHFGQPLRIITDNGTNFAADDLQRWFKELHIEHSFSSVAHPQGNGQVEAVNKSIVDGIKARLGTQRRGWVDELPSILWAHRTMPKTSNGETPFSLVYGSEAVIPAEIGLPSPRMLSMNMINNEEERRLDLDLLEERREMAAINKAKYKTKLEKYYNSKVRICTFNPGDYVQRDNEASNAEKPGKLAPKLEGPYVIDEVLGKGAYKLRILENKEVPRAWNAQQLRKCYM